MQELIAAVNALIQLGGWGALLLVGIAIVLGGMRRAWVWGWQFDKEVARGDRLELAVAANAKAMDRLSDSVETIVETALRERAESRSRRA